MTKFKKILLRTIFLGSAALLLTSASCNQKEKPDITIALQDSSYGEDTQNTKIKLEKLFNSKLKSKNINVKILINDETNVDSIIKGTEYGFGFVTAGQLSNYLEKANLDFVPEIQTLTNAFYADKNGVEYTNGTNQDPLRMTADKENQKFSELPVNNWNEENWNGSIWVNQYDQIDNSKTEFNKVPYQRGAIWIYGNDDLRNQIINAWNNKDWNTFKNFGLIIGENDSSSKYLLPQNLFRKHFNKPGNEFTSFVSIKDDPKIVTAASPIKAVEKRNDYKIIFDNQGSYAYTKKSKLIERYNSKNGESLQLFMLTNPTPYNIGIFNSNVPKNIRDAITDVFTSLSNEENSWGDALGFNGYEKINNFDTQKNMILKNK